MKRLMILTMAAVLLIGVSADAAISTSVTNGGFEDGVDDGSGFHDVIPDWVDFYIPVAGEAGQVGYWDSKHDGISGFPDFTGTRAACLGTYDTGDSATIYQSLGTVEAGDVGLPFTLSANCVPRCLTDRDGTHLYTVAFRSGTSSGVKGTIMGTEATLSITSPRSSESQPWNTLKATYFPAAGDIGTEIFAVIDTVLTDQSGAGITGVRRGFVDKVSVANVDPAYQASNPSPPDLATLVDPAALSLSWDAPAGGPYKYDVYADPNEAKVAAGDAGCAYTSSNQTGLSYPPAPELDYATTWYWRVDTKDNTTEALITAGDVWSFTTGGTVSNLEAQGYEWALLDWDADDALPASYDVYISTNPADLGTPTNTTETELEVDVDPNTVYYWAVDTKDGGGAVMVAGETVSFTTGVLQAHWKMNESGATAIDATGNGYDMDMSLLPDPNSDPGVIRGSRYYPSVAEGALSTSSPDMGLGDLAQFSGSVWFKKTAGTNAQYIITWNAGDYDLMVYSRTGGANAAVRFRDDTIKKSSYWYPEGNPFPNDQWTHLVVTYDAAASPRTRVYINGAYWGGTNTDRGPAVKSVGIMSIGNRVGGPMDDARMYTSALSPQDVLDLYDLGALAHNPAPADEAERVALDTDCQWDPGFDITAQEFQISTVADFSTLVDSATLAAGATSYDPLGGTDLDLDTLYYWRVLSEQDSGAWSLTGDTWSFTTIGPIAANPDPLDTATDVAQNKILGWDSGAGYNPAVDNHQVYIAAGTTEGDLPGVPTATVTAEAFDPDLAFETDYVWRVDEFIGGTLYTGDVWTFTTGAPLCDPPLLADTNGDCVVDMTDFAQLAAEWLDCTLVNGDCP